MEGKITVLDPVEDETTSEDKMRALAAEIIDPIVEHLELLDEEGRTEVGRGVRGVLSEKGMRNKFADLVGINEAFVPNYLADRVDTILTDFRIVQEVLDSRGACGIEGAMEALKISGDHYGLSQKLAELVCSGEHRFNRRNYEKLIQVAPSGSDAQFMIWDGLVRNFSVTVANFTEMVPFLGGFDSNYSNVFVMCFRSQVDRGKKGNPTKTALAFEKIIKAAEEGSVLQMFLVREYMNIDGSDYSDEVVQNLDGQSLLCFLEKIADKGDITKVVEIIEGLDPAVWGFTGVEDEDFIEKRVVSSKLFMDVIAIMRDSGAAAASDYAALLNNVCGKTVNDEDAVKILRGMTGGYVNEQGQIIGHDLGEENSKMIVSVVDNPVLARWYAKKMVGENEYIGEVIEDARASNRGGKSRLSLPFSLGVIFANSTNEMKAALEMTIQREVTTGMSTVLDSCKEAITEGRTDGVMSLYLHLGNKSPIFSSELARILDEALDSSSGQREIFEKFLKKRPEDSRKVGISRIVRDVKKRAEDIISKGKE